ncbi:transcription termination/antitermination NusG family protein [Thomasclavelia sp.]|uniref:transcription termination/antitermination NusG family protein n=1 Tax=Thomasclavelia sp. TaxID=3025757 RepID=UPI0025DD04D7|nr:transcription termination/antitermination NusG family protein [Thomasclavelia sp.]
MYWYFINVQSKHTKAVIDFFNNQKNTLAFIPKMEKWFNAKRIKNYIIQDLYPDYIFVKSSLNEKEFINEYKDFFKEIKDIAVLVKQGNSYSMERSIQGLYERLFNRDGIITHSSGNIIHSRLKVDQGPLCGLEQFIIKINRHQRTAILDFKQNNLSLVVPLEVISKS